MDLNFNLVKNFFNKVLLADILLGLLVCILVCIFYERTIIFYVMMHIHLILISSLMNLLFNFRKILSELLINPWFSIGYIIPLVVEVLLGTFATLIRATLSQSVTFQDVIIICFTPFTIVLLPFIFPNLQTLVSSEAKFNIYQNFNIFGLLCNTLILILGSLFGLYLTNQIYN